MGTTLISLSQMTMSTLAVNELKKNNLPYLFILTDPTAGGITASYAMLGDIHLAEPNAMIGFAGRRVIEDTIREELPEDFQKAERMLDHGLIDMVIHRKDLRNTLIRILSLLCQKTPNDLNLQSMDIESLNLSKTVNAESSLGNEEMIGN